MIKALKNNKKSQKQAKNKGKCRNWNKHTKKKHNFLFKKENVHAYINHMKM